MALDTQPFTTLFDVKERTRLGPAEYSEFPYHYLNESARPEFGRARELLESWFAAYPHSGRAELRARMVKRKKGSFEGAFFELYCYSFLSRQGFSPGVHPPLPNEKKTHPDFIVQLGDTPICYFESTAVRDRAPDTEERLDRLYDDLNRLRSKNFMLDVQVWGSVPRTNPPIHEIRRELRIWLDSIDPDTVIAGNEGNENRPTDKHVFRREGWHLQFFAVPLRKELRGVTDIDMRLVGSTMHFGGHRLWMRSSRY